jgi:hypothetical protein
MATQRDFCFVVGLLAALCIGAAVVTASAQPAAGPPKPDQQAAPKDALPREGSPGAQGPSHDDRRAKRDVDGEHPDHAPTDKSKGSPTKGAGSPTKGAGTPEMRMKDLGPVDTRIAVPPQPHRTDERRQNPLLHSPTGLRAQPPHIQHPGGAITRNSIGEVVPSSAQPGARAPSQGSSPGAGAPPVTTHGSAGPGNPAAAPGNPAATPFHAAPITAAPEAPRSTINGTGVARRGNGPSGIGGQAKPLAGINGSTIRPKH